MQRLWWCNLYNFYITTKCSAMLHMSFFALCCFLPFLPSYFGISVFLLCVIFWWIKGSAEIARTDISRPDNKYVKSQWISKHSVGPERLSVYTINNQSRTNNVVDIEVYFMSYLLCFVEKHRKTLIRYTIIRTDDEEYYYKLIDEVHVIFHAA